MADASTGTLVVKNVHPAADGEYEMNFSLDVMNGEEAHLIKQISGVRINELEDALSAGDYDLILAYASVAMMRSGKKIPIEVLRAAPLGSVSIKDEPEDETSPPSPSVPLPTPDDAELSSGSSSGSSSESPETTPEPGGDPG